VQNRIVHQAKHSLLVTGAAGHVGEETCRILNSTNRRVIATDISAPAVVDPRLNTSGIALVRCDLRQPEPIKELLASHPVRTIIHLAGVLPTAFRADPIAGAELNLTASVALMNEAIRAGVKRFIFASSMSVYGSVPSMRPLTEVEAATPDDPYGASKRAIELVGEALAANHQIEFVALRIARVVGPGIKKSSSLWRSQIFESNSPAPIHIPFASDAKLSLVHVHEVAQMLVTLADASEIKHSIYNSPAEIVEAGQLKTMVERTTGNRVELGPADANAGPTCDGSRFASEFRLSPRRMEDYLSAVGK
jgi:UDP-glucose 4-epimerase